MENAVFDLETLCAARPDAMMTCSRTHRARVFGAYSARIIDLFVLIGDMALRRADAHLAALLLAHGDVTDGPAFSAERLSILSGVQLEIVRQQLSGFARNGWVTFSPAGVRPTDMAALARLAGVLRPTPSA